MPISHNLNNDTIAAIATPQGTGALGIVRISGTDAIDKANLIFPKKDLAKAESHTLHYGPLVYKGEIVDEVVVSVFKSPHSFTGENSVEISCHGSPYILQQVMEILVDLGVRPAQPGEYTMRAFMNGRMDLSQAEAVADLIAAESAAAHKTALQQMRGGFSHKIKELRKQLVDFASLIELELDFAEEDVEFADRASLQKLLDDIYNEAKKLADSFRLGNVIKEGVQVVIAGRPNAGKSTLLNALLNEERAIVSEIPGTTRDTIEDVMTIDGIRFRFIDTAGIRESSETIERMGIERTYGKIKDADIVIYLYDVNNTSQADLEEDVQSLGQDKTVILAGNKIDQIGGAIPNFKFQISNFKSLFLSAKHGHNLDQLKTMLVSSLGLDPKALSFDETIVTNVRHYHSLTSIMNAVKRIKAALEERVTGDFLASDIRNALNALAEITGEVTNDEILGNIFGKFCIGK